MPGFAETYIVPPAPVLDAWDLTGAVPKGRVISNFLERASVFPSMQAPSLHWFTTADGRGGAILLKSENVISVDSRICQCIDTADQQLSAAPLRPYLVSGTTCQGSATRTNRPFQEYSIGIIEYVDGTVSLLDIIRTTA